MTWGGVAFGSAAHCHAVPRGKGGVTVNKMQTQLRKTPEGSKFQDFCFVHFINITC